MGTVVTKVFGPYVIHDSFTFTLTYGGSIIRLDLVTTPYPKASLFLDSQLLWVRVLPTGSESCDLPQSPSV